MSQPSPCFVRKRDALTAANFINLCHAKEDPGGIGYVLVTVTELETGRKIATRTIVADHDSMVRQPGTGNALKHGVGFDIEVVVSTSVRPMRTVQTKNPADRTSKNLSGPDP